MKFKIRDGFVAHVSEKIEIEEGKFETQVQTFYGGKVVDLSAEQAQDHAHKLEPLDKAATEFLVSRHVPGPEKSVQIDIDALVSTKVAEALAKAAADKTPAA